jgi:hypothetical protein
MKKSLLIAVVFGAVFSNAALHAADYQKKVPLSLDAKRGYLLVRMGERAPELWNVLSLLPYDEKLEDARGKGRAKANPVAKGDDRSILIGPKAHLVELDHVRTYLVAITPGRYVIAGGPTTCYCLGSFQFDAVAGTITDMGTIYIGPENGTSPWKELASIRSSPDIEARDYTVADALIISPATQASVLPDGLKDYARVLANYAPAQRLGNHAGQLINKALPMGIPK